MTNMTPFEYLNYYRIQQSTDFLEHSDDGISVVATRAGFNNISYYNRIFRRYMHMTPSEFRRNCLENVGITMQGYNLIVVFNENADQVLLCRRRKDPYRGLSNFVGGKIEENEDGLDAAYRELAEETAITRQDILLSHVMDFTYYYEKSYLEVYAGKLNKAVEVCGEENELYWSALDCDFFDTSQYAGIGNMGHIMLEIEEFRRELLK